MTDLPDKIICKQTNDVQYLNSRGKIAHFEALFPSGKGFEESNIITSIEASCDSGVAEAGVCTLGKGVAGDSAGLPFALGVFDFSRDP